MRNLRLSYVCLPLAIVGILWSLPLHAAGPRFHAECGHQAWNTYLNDAGEMLPGIADLYSTEGLRRAFLSGCQFPDWGFRGINGDAAEDSHWTPFHEIYWSVLNDTYPAAAWKTVSRGQPLRIADLGEDVQKRWAFFLGMVCHSAVDIPYHFDDGPHLGMLSRTLKENGANHGECELASDVFTQNDRGILPDMIGEQWWPYDDILAAYARTSRAVDSAQLDKGKGEVQAGTNILGLAGSAPYFIVRNKYPWLRQHNADYYYGGLDQGAALTAICIKYWYARFQGWHYLQNIPQYGGCIKGLYAQPPCEDAVIDSARPGNNTGAEPWLEVGNGRRTLLRFDLSSIPPETRLQEVRLWLYLAVPPSSDCVVDVFPVNRAWQEGVGATDDVDGVEGTAARPLDVSWESARHGAERWAAPGCGKVPEDREAQPAASTRIAAGGEGRWIYWDLTGQVQLWLNNPDQNHGILLQQAENIESDAVPLRFWSSQAFKNRSDGFCGGIRIAGRPTLVTIGAQE